VLADRSGPYRRLAGLVANYGRAIRYDLLTRCGGLDLAVEWRARRWSKLLAIIDLLPRDSAFVEALSADETLAEAIADRPDPPRPGPRVSEFSPTVEVLTAILDRLGDLGQIIAATKGGKPRRVPYAPRPATALDRVRRRRREAKRTRLVSKLLPHKSTDT
jgi:hypothetical protein